MIILGLQIKQQKRYYKNHQKVPLLFFELNTIKADSAGIADLDFIESMKNH